MVGWILAPKRCLRGAEGNLCALRGNLPTHQEKESLFLKRKVSFPETSRKAGVTNRSQVGLVWL